MTALVQPVHTGTLNDRPLRFFRAPRAGDHLPWHAVDDLHLCLGLPRDLRRHFQQRLKSSEWKDDVRTVAVAEGILTVAPHFMAQGLIGSMIEVGRASVSTEIAYGRQVKNAWDAMMGDLPPGESFTRMVAAFHVSGRVGSVH